MGFWYVCKRNIPSPIINKAHFDKNVSHNKIKHVSKGT